MFSTFEAPPANEFRKTRVTSAFAERQCSRFAQENAGLSYVADDRSDAGASPSYEELLTQNQRRSAENHGLRSRVSELEERLAEIERRMSQNSGNSGKPSSRDPVAERERQAELRRQQGAFGKRARGKQRGSKGTTLQMSPNPDEIVDHRPEQCGRCGAGLDAAPDKGYHARQVVDVPGVEPTTTEHRAHTYGCSCGHDTTAPFPDQVRYPASYGPRARTIVAYLLARQHISNRRAAEAMADLFGLDISTGVIGSIYAEAGRRLQGFIAALVVLLKSLPVLHADETSDRIGTKNCWMHVVSTGLYTLIHASVTRGSEAIEQAGVLKGYKGVIVHDRLALYWKLKHAKHGLCNAHLLRDLADVAVVATQTAWAAGLAALLVEINAACDVARRRGWKHPRALDNAQFHQAVQGPRHRGPGGQPRTGTPQAQPGGAPLVQPRDGLCHPPNVDPPLHERPPGRVHEQSSRAGSGAHEASSQDCRPVPKPRGRRAPRPPAQLSLHDPQEQRLRHRRPHPPLRRRHVDAAEAYLNTYHERAVPKYHISDQRRRPETTGDHR